MSKILVTDAQVKKYNIQQSMSRRGNYWDNAPQEAYFGHMKDELNLDTFLLLEMYVTK